MSHACKKLTRDLNASRIKGVLEKLMKARKEVDEEIRGIVAGVCQQSSNFLVTSYWDCDKSPTGLCVYDELDDPAHDHCIWCGAPEERK